MLFQTTPPCPNLMHHVCLLLIPFFMLSSCSAATASPALNTPKGRNAVPRRPDFANSLKQSKRCTLHAAFIRS